MTRRRPNFFLNEFRAAIRSGILIALGIPGAFGLLGSFGFPFDWSFFVWAHRNFSEAAYWFWNSFLQLPFSQEAATLITSAALFATVPIRAIWQKVPRMNGDAIHEAWLNNSKISFFTGAIVYLVCIHIGLNILLTNNGLTSNIFFNPLTFLSFVILGISFSSAALFPRALFALVIAIALVKFADIAGEFMTNRFEASPPPIVTNLPYVIGFGFVAHDS